MTDYYAPDITDPDMPEYEYEDSAEIAPVNVRIEGTDVEQVAPQFGSCMTWTVPQFGVGTPIQVLPRKLHRSKARILVASLGSLTAEQTVTNPGAGNQAVYTVPATSGPVTLQAVTFTMTTDAVVGNRQARVQVVDSSGNVVATFQASGSVPASTALNVSLNVGSSQTGNATSGTSFGSIAPLTLYPGWKVQTTVAGFDAGDTITGFGVTFAGNGTGSVVFNNKPDALSIPQGITAVTSGFFTEWESQQPLYAIAVGGQATVSVLDETYE